MMCRVLVILTALQLSESSYKMFSYIDIHVLNHPCMLEVKLT